MIDTSGLAFIIHCPQCGVLCPHLIIDGQPTGDPSSVIAAVQCGSCGHPSVVAATIMDDGETTIFEFLS